MASAISRRLTSKLLNPSSSSALFSLYPSSYHTNPNNSHQSLLNPTPNFTDFNHRSSFPRIRVSPNHSSIRSHTSFDPSFKIQSLSPNLYQPPKFFSTSTPQSDPEETQKPNENPTQTHFRWTQEITGPTVERDVSTLANETRQALDEMFKTIYNLNNGFALFGLIQLGLVCQVFSQPRSLCAELFGNWAAIFAVVHAQKVTEANEFHQENGGAT